jgi:hypothetical protein
MSRSHKCERCTQECVRHGFGQAGGPRWVRRPLLAMLQTRASVCDSIKPNFSSLEGM